MGVDNDSLAARVEQFHQFLNIDMRVDNLHHILQLVDIYNTILILVNCFELFVQLEYAFVMSPHIVVKEAPLQLLPGDQVVGQFVLLYAGDYL